MKIGLLSFEYPPETGFGGIGTYTWYQARGLAKLGHEVHVLAGATEPTELRSSEHDGVRVHRYRSSSRWMKTFERLGNRKMWWTKNRLENALSMNQGLGQLLRQVELDVLEMPECGAEGALVNRRRRLHTVVKFHSPAELIMGHYDDIPPSDQRWCAFVERRGIQAAGGFTSCSKFLADEVHAKMGLRRPITVVANGIDVELFDRADQLDARERFDLPRDRPMIFFAGRMEPRKGIHLVKDIATRLLRDHEVAMVFAGQDLFGTMEKEILPAVQALDLKGSLHYVGKLDLQAVGSCLRQTDVFFIPSTWENCPYSCLEAMAAGRAIVSSDAGGLPELIQHGENGLVARSEDVDQFVEALAKLVEDGETRQRLGDAARRTVEARYTDVAIAEKSVAAYRKSFELPE